MPNARQPRNLPFDIGLGTATAALAVAFVLTVGATGPAQAQTFSVLHNFTGGADGRTPTAGVTIDGESLYGTAVNGGTGCGTVFELRQKGSSWPLSPLYSFPAAPPDYGCDPEARVIVGPNGSLFGTTYGGGEPGYGTVFNLKPSPTACPSVICPWTETVRYSFSGPPDGASPGYGDLLFDSAGNIYGTTYLGGVANSDCAPYQSQTCGVVYKLTLSNGIWTQSVLYSFEGGSDGGNPYAGVIFDQAGNLYGTTYYGGLGYGTVFQLTPSGSGWTENILYKFQNGSDGSLPFAGLIFDPSGSGNLYGATSTGGTGGGGTVFELSPPGSWTTFTVLYSFTGGGGGPDCTPIQNPSILGPAASLFVEGSNLYGTTFCDGALGFGNVFELTPSGNSWIYTDLHDFTGGSDGANPISNVVFDTSGNLYGTASGGGNPNCDDGYGCGVVWEITP
jgi:uncharacterized repeat protein (TIGR03803 family)